jgi:alpha-galactosidase
MPHDNVLVHYNLGSLGTREDYKPIEKALTPGGSLQLGSIDGRASGQTWPYFNLESAQASVIAAVGWPGQWTAKFTVDDSGALRMRAGQELTHFTLHPGEQVRSPLIALLFHQGDWLRSQNMWRRWMIAHNVPRPGGKLPEPIIGGSSDVWTVLMQEATEENQKQFIAGFLDRGVPINTWWMDAGWHQGARAAWSFVGTWEVDLERFPNGIRAVSDYAHQRGLRTLLWFEPERVYTGTWLFVNRSQWLLGSDSTRLLDLGNPEARQCEVGPRAGADEIGSQYRRLRPGVQAERIVGGLGRPGVDHDPGRSTGIAIPGAHSPVRTGSYGVGPGEGQGRVQVDVISLSRGHRQVAEIDRHPPCC